MNSSYRRMKFSYHKDLRRTDVMNSEWYNSYDPTTHTIITYWVDSEGNFHEYSSIHYNWPSISKSLVRFISKKKFSIAIIKMKMESK